MKVIEIINKIANGEKIPKFEIGGGTYLMGRDGFLKEEDTGLARWSIYKEWLNRDVKVVGEENEYFDNENEELEKLDEYDFGGNKDFDDVDFDIEHLIDKINEIIEYLNENEK